MTELYNNYTNHIGIRICHEFGRIDFLPIRGGAHQGIRYALTL